MHPARTAYSSAYLRYHQLIAAGAAPAYRPAGRRGPAVSGAAAPARRRPGRGTGYDVVFVADWRFLESCAADRGGRDAGAGRRRPAGGGAAAGVVPGGLSGAAAALRAGAGPGQRGRDRPDRAGRPGRGGLLLVRQAAVLQFTAGVQSGVRRGGPLVVADRAPVRADGTDRRYEPADLHGGGAPALRRRPGLGAAGRRGAGRSAYGSTPRSASPSRTCPPPSRRPAGWPSAPATSPARRWSAPTCATRRPGRRTSPTASRGAAGCPTSTSGCGCRTGRAASSRSSCRRAWLGYEAADLGPRPFLHQLDFYLHFPPPRGAEWYSRPALEAAAMGCVVVMPERYAGLLRRRRRLLRTLGRGRPADRPLPGRSGAVRRAEPAGPGGGRQGARPGPGWSNGSWRWLPVTTRRDARVTDGVTHPKLKKAGPESCSAGRPAGRRPACWSWR